MGPRTRGRPEPAIEPILSGFEITHFDRPGGHQGGLREGAQTPCSFAA